MAQYPLRSETAEGQIVTTPTYTLRRITWVLVCGRWVGTVAGLTGPFKYEVWQAANTARWSLETWVGPPPWGLKVDYATLEGAQDIAEGHWRSWAEANVVEVK